MDVNTQIALVMCALSEDGTKLTTEKLEEIIPWVALPNYIHVLYKDRHPTHFLPGTQGNSSWMYYPNLDVLKELTKENVTEKVIMYAMPKNERKYATLDEISMSAFYFYNATHPYMRYLAAHMIQDRTFYSNEACKRLGVTSEWMSPMDRHTIFYIKAAKLLYEKTGIVMNNKDLNDVVVPALKKAYPEVMYSAVDIFSRLDKSVDERITALDFELTECERSYFGESNLDEIAEAVVQSIFMKTKSVLARV